MSPPVADPVLVDDWHVVARSEQVTAEAPLGVRLLGLDLVLWRSGNELLVWQDLCVHRGTRHREAGSVDLPGLPSAHGVLRQAC